MSLSLRWLRRWQRKKPVLPVYEVRFDPRGVFGPWFAKEPMPWIVVELWSHLSVEGRELYSTAPENDFTVVVGLFPDGEVAKRYAAWIQVHNSDCREAQAAEVVRIPPEFGADDG